jgi:hypothetical protein
VKRNGTKRYICETKRNETNQNDNVPKPWIFFFREFRYQVWQTKMLFNSFEQNLVHKRQIIVKDWKKKEIISNKHYKQS